MKFILKSISKSIGSQRIQLSDYTGLIYLLRYHPWFLLLLVPTIYDGYVR
jgi:hypothetical protein